MLNGTWASEGYRRLTISDPKPRIIHKATVKDRVLYQAIYQILYPIFEEIFIFDSYSSRVGKGTHAGIRRLRVFLRKLSQNYTKSVYILKCDIRKFFDSIDHTLLKSFLKRDIDCGKTLNLLFLVIDSFHKVVGKGLPLGNVTSQVLANVYLHYFDSYIKKELGIRYYLRYNDDFVILAENQFELYQILLQVKNFLAYELKLELHPHKISIRKYHLGVDFLGTVILPHYSVLRTKTKRRFLKKLMRPLTNSQIESYLGHLSHTKSRRVRELLYKARLRK